MLTVFAICVILFFVGCKNGYESIKKSNSDENADKSQVVNDVLIENTSSRRYSKYRKERWDFGAYRRSLWI